MYWKMRTIFHYAILLLTLSSEHSMMPPTDSVHAAISTSPHVRPIAQISFSTIFRQVALSLPCFLLPCGVHSFGLRDSIESYLTNMSEPPETTPIYCCINWLGICFGVQVLIRDSPGPEIRHILRRHPLWNVSI